MKDSSKGGKPKAPGGAKSKESGKPLVSVQAGNDGRPRAQVAYEGDDEFSVLSTQDARRKKPRVELAPHEPNDVEKKALPQTAEGEAKQESKWHFVRKIFGE